LGVTQAQIDALRPYGLLALDNVTGFHDGRSGPGRLHTLLRAIRHAGRSGQECHYVEMDVRNLGGLNARLGHSGANEVFAALAAAVCQELSAAASTAVFFRHGGDELSAVLIDASAQAVEAAFAAVHRRAAERASAFGVQDVLHPKRPLDRRSRGTGVRFGLVQLQPEHEGDLARLFREADEDVRRRDDRGRP
jgi:GGDEF domain-containing protein